MAKARCEAEELGSEETIPFLDLKRGLGPGLYRRLPHHQDGISAHPVRAMLVNIISLSMG